MINWFKKNTIKNKIEEIEKSLEKAGTLRLKDIETNQKIWKQLQNRNINKFNNFYNLCLYSSIVNNDIAMLYDDYIMSKSSMKKNLYARLLSMTIFEFLDDIHHLMGKDFILELNSNKLSEFHDERKKISKRFSALKNKHQKELKKIRNNAAAHKTKKAKDLVELTKEKPFEDLNSIAKEITFINQDLIKLTTKIINIITATLIHEFDNSNPK